MRTIFQFIVAVLVFTSASWADEGSQLFGDWGGARTLLSDNGIEVESILTLDDVSNVSGGAERKGGVLGNYDLTASIDTEKAGAWNGGTVFIYGLGNWGKKPSEFIGDLQGTDNIQAPTTFKLYEAWIDQRFYGEKLSVLAGLHDYNSEFYSLDYAGGLLNSSFGLGVEAAQVGPSIFPTTSLALRVRLAPSENSYFQVAAYDGVPGDPNNERGTHVKLNKGDGVFYAAESGILGGDSADYYKLGLGAWYHSTDFETFAEEFAGSNAGFYLIGEKRLYSETDSEQGLGAFFQLGGTDGDKNQIANYFGFGVNYKGLLPSRDSDLLSFGIAHARNGDQFRALNLGVERAETTYELNYRFEVTPFFAVTPDFQYIHNPGTEGLDDATVLSARIELAM